MIEEIVKQLKGKKINSSRAEYYCSYADSTVIIFARTPDTGKIMVPTELASEWVRAYDHGLINLDMTAREMRGIVQDNSDWAAYQHGFETQMYAIVKTWAEAHPR
jgi:hypothetical protein